MHHLSEESTPGSRRRSSSIRAHGPQCISQEDLADACHGNCHRQLPVNLGDEVRIYSCSADMWLDGKVTDAQEFPSVCVEYKVDHHWFRKKLIWPCEHIKLSRVQAEQPHPSVEDGCEISTSEMDPDASTYPAAEVRDLASYQSMDTIWSLLESGDVVLIKGAWLLEQFWTENEAAGSPGVLPCRQELPREAIWSVADLKDKFCSWYSPITNLIHGALKLVAISHCWYLPEHPDPEGHQVQQVIPLLVALEGTRNYFTRYDGENHVALFWAWCSLYQRRRHIKDGPLERTPDEERAFGRSLRNMHVWYAHEHIHTWCLTSVPRGIRDYHLRGWTTWELCISLLLTGCKDSKAKVLDLALYDADTVRRHPRSKDPIYSDVVSTCQALRQVPLLPQDFNEMIEQKAFTARNADLPVLKKNYSDAFSAILGSCSKLCYRNLGWNDTHAAALARILPSCALLQDLDLQDNLISDKGLRVLVSALKRCASFCENGVLRFQGNRCSLLEVHKLACEVNFDIRIELGHYTEEAGNLTPMFMR
eukprot:TRINITY_DN7804_c0_g2_i1.p1 TRINITY_DN7804_c0_g2~~TRINITY_DN7804_c0_g2_i1.p1  ORF type:complete len:535 (-),score=61.14 TRINITY_DN7804_c0_g2_i1:130-1734(-)